jgi:hypothetical protein
MVAGSLAPTIAGGRGHPHVVDEAIHGHAHLHGSGAAPAPGHAHGR